MDQYLAKGHTFPDQDWWEEKKTDVSFLYTVEEETECDSRPTDKSQAEVTVEVGRRERSEDSMRNGSKLQLDSWIEEFRHDGGPTPSKYLFYFWLCLLLRISSLAGYVNLSYPILRSLTRKKKGYYEEMEVKNRELYQQIDRVSANLRHVSETVERLQQTVDGADMPASQADSVRRLLRQKAVKMMENSDLVNVLMNVFKNTASKTVERNPNDGEPIRTYGSSVDLV